MKGGYWAGCTVLQHGGFLIKDNKPPGEICIVCSHLQGEHVFPVQGIQAPFSRRTKNNKKKTESVKSQRIFNGHEKTV